MSISLKLPENILLKPTITVFGVGGAGGNAVNNMIRSNLQGAKFVVANTDAQALEHSLAEHKIQLGLTTTKGLGAGASPDVGMAAAQESEGEILEHLQGSNMVFITAGMGGGTGTGAAPVIAGLAKQLGILTVGVVTKPFNFEGHYRMKLADYGLNELQKNVDTLIVIPNQNLFLIANENTTFADAFKMADDVLHSGVRGVTDLMIMPGLINLDFADIRAVMSEMGKAMMGTGEAANSPDRAIRAAEAAISNPLLDHRSIKGAKGVLINITGGMDMTLFEVDAAANRIREEVGDNEANIIFGSTFNKELDGLIRVSVVATGIDIDDNVQPKANFFTRTEAVISPITTTPFVETAPTPTEEVEPEIQTFASETTNSENFITEPEFIEEKTKEELAPQLENPIEKVIRSSVAAASEQPKIISPIVPIKAETTEQAKPRLSLFSRMLSSIKSPEKHEQGKTSEVSQHNLAPKSDKVTPVTEQADIYDIPAFLRRNK